MPLHALPFPTVRAVFPTSSDFHETSVTAFHGRNQEQQADGSARFGSFCAHRSNLDDLIPSGDLPARDIQPFVPREALREAEKLFGRFAGDQPRSTGRTAARRQSPPMPSLRLLW